MLKNVLNTLERMLNERFTVEILEEQGGTSEVHKVVTSNSTYILKTAYKDRYREWLRNESRNLTLINQYNQVLTPRFYNFIEEEESSHLLMSFEKGITLTLALERAASKEERCNLIRSFGAFLQVLHGTVLPQSLKADELWLDKQLAIAQRYVKREQTEGSMDLLQHLYESRPAPIEETLIHGDCTTDNVLVDNGKLTMFIDVAGMTIGDPRYDVALAIRSYVNDSLLVDAFYKGYTRLKITDDEFCYFDRGLYEFF